MYRVISIKSVIEDKILDEFNIRNLIICLKRLDTKKSLD